MTCKSFGDQNFLRLSQDYVALEVEEVPHNTRDFIKVKLKVIFSFLRIGLETVSSYILVSAVLNLLKCVYSIVGKSQ